MLRAIDALQPPGLSATRRRVWISRAVAAAFAIAVLATLVFALLPIAKLVATDPVRALQGSSARAFGGKNLGRFRFALATSQIALSMLLLVLAALFTQSLANIARVDLGLRTESIVTFMVAPNLNGYSDERQAQTLDAIERELEAEPGVTHVGLLRAVAVLSGSEWGTSVFVEGYEPARNDGSRRQRESASARGSSTRSRFRCSRAACSRRPIRSTGRSSPSSTRASRSVSVSAHNPVGKRLGESRRGSCDIEIVGLVRDAAYELRQGRSFPRSS